MNQDLPIFHRKELSLLKEFYHSKGQRILIISGPNGSGKTSLLKLFLNDLKKQIEDDYIFLSYSNSSSGLMDLISPTTKLLIIDDFDNSVEFRGITVRHIKSISDKYENLKIILVAKNKPFNVATKNDIYSRAQYLEIGSLTDLEIELFYNRMIKNTKILSSDYEKILKTIKPTIGALKDINELIKSQLKPTIDLIAQIQNTFRATGLIDINGNPISSDSSQSHEMTRSIRVVNSSLLERVRIDPSFLYQMSPRQFEELVADLLSEEGFNVNLTQATRDGGKDIFIAHNNKIGDFLYYIECKHYSRDNPIGVNLVRELYGTVTHDRATAGMLITTSYFSPDAIDFVRKIKHQLSLKDYIILQDWINSIFNRK